MVEVNDITEALHNEIDAVLEADRALLLRLVKSYREGVCDVLPSAEESFREGWRDVLAGNAHPVPNFLNSRDSGTAALWESAGFGHLTTTK